MGIYDQKQLERDLRLISFVFGERQREGMCSVSVVNHDGVIIRDEYLDTPTVQSAYRDIVRRIDITELLAESSVGVKILKLALAAEEVQKARYVGFGVSQ